MAILDNKRANTLITVEWWCSNIAFVFGLLYFVVLAMDSDAPDSATPNKEEFIRYQIPFHYFRNFFFPELLKFVVIILSFLILNFRLVPTALRHPKQIRYWLLIFSVPVLVAIVHTISDCYTHRYFIVIHGDEALKYWVQSGVDVSLDLFLIFTGHQIIKYVGVFFLQRSVGIERRFILLNPENLTGITIFMLIVFYLLVWQIPLELLSTIVPIGLSALLLQGYSFRKLLPDAMTRRRPLLHYLSRIIFICILGFFVVWTVLLVATGEAELPVAIAISNSLLQFLLVAPALFFLFKRKIRGNEEIFALKKELGRTEADLDFLRSQINPHFLFNAFNTIYAISIRENATQTSQGVEMLGEMMRFMLHENAKDFIDLEREVKYLKNFISFQELRLTGAPDVVVEAKIREESYSGHRIAPMLLIPFVENAFKHGISFLEKSHLRISLELKDSLLYFDVYNTKHRRHGSDPEQHSNGVGLVNVSKRLQLVYPGRHSLMVRETESDFSVQLMLDLS